MRDNRIRVKRELVDDLKEVCPELYQRQANRGIKATIILTQNRVEAGVYEMTDGTFKLIAGPERIFNEWLKKIGGQK
jgi:predicted transcriptional regulator